MTKYEIMPSGARLVVNEMKGFEGVSLKLFVGVGSGNEQDPKDFGISHLIEHMMFKGTKKRTSYDIVKEFDEYGIQSNAYTAKNQTCYFTYGTNESLNKSAEILSDMFFNSTFSEEELEREKEVVVEEILMYADRPDAVCETKLDEIFFAGTNFSHDIAGSVESVRAISRKQILNYYSLHYTPKNITIAIAGNVTIDEARKLAYDHFEQNFKQKERYEFKKQESTFEISTTELKVEKETNQAQVMLAYQTENRYNSQELMVNNYIAQMLGGSMSSRLFQEVREKLGLVYTINATNEANELTGMFSISLGTSLNKVSLALKTIKKVLNDVCTNGFNEKEFSQVRAMIISAIKLSSDSPSRQASIIATQLQFENSISTKEELIRKYENITLEEVNEKAKKIFGGKFCLVMVGEKNDLNLIEEFNN